jgi:hypothetical protein
MHSDERTDAHVQAIARAVVLEFFVKMGVDASDPKSLLELQLDFAHVRGWRRGTQIIKNTSMKAAITFLITGALGFVVYLFTGRTH